MIKVSICIPTFDQALFIEQAVRSAAQQTLPPFEIIVSDDCSTDNTKLILQKLSLEIHFLKVLFQPKNLGITLNTNACLRLATGEFVVRLDSDDYLSSNYVQKLTDVLIQNPEAGYGHAAVQEIDSKGNFLNKRKLFRKSGFQSGNEALKGAISGYRVAANILIFRRTALLKVGFITTNINFAEDYYLAASLAAAGFGNVYIDEVLSFYRVWLDTGNTRQRRKLAEIIGYRKVFEEVLEPAFRNNGWSLTRLRRKRTSYACRNADCLSWKVYSSKEKEELAFELSQLSCSPKSKCVMWLYMNGFGIVLNQWSRLQSLIRLKVKSVLLR